VCPMCEDPAAAALQRNANEKGPTRRALVERLPRSARQNLTDKPSENSVESKRSPK